MTISDATLSLTTALCLTALQQAGASEIEQQYAQDMAVVLIAEHRRTVPNLDDAERFLKARRAERTIQETGLLWNSESEEQHWQ